MAVCYLNDSVMDFGVGDTRDEGVAKLIVNDIGNCVVIVASWRKKI